MKVLNLPTVKFIHSNPYKKEVTMDSLVTLPMYFPKGVVYKGYPDDWPY